MSAPMPRPTRVHPAERRAALPRKLAVPALRTAASRRSCRIRPPLAPSVLAGAVPTDGNGPAAEARPRELAVPWRDCAAPAHDAHRLSCRCCIWASNGSEGSPRGSAVIALVAPPPVLGLGG